MNGLHAPDDTDIPTPPIAVPEKRVPERRRFRSRLGQEIPLPLGWKITLLVVGWVFVLLGIIGFFLPILQGGIFFVAGFAILSIVSDRVHDFLRARFSRWPRGWRRLLKVRRWMERHLHRHHRRRHDRHHDRR